MEMLTFLLSKTKNFHTLVPICWDRKLNRAPIVPNQVMFLYIADHLRLSSSKVCEYLGRIVEDEIEPKTLGGFLQTVCRGAVNHLVTEDITRICGNDGFLIRVFQVLFRQ